jgi:tetratricopeptide (TPR) repeat protein
MFRWLVSICRTPAARLTLSACLLSLLPAHAQGQTPVSPAQFDPSDVYFQGYLSRRAAEQLEANGDFIGATEKLKSARKLFETIHSYYPAWKPEMVKNSITKNFESLTRLHQKTEEQRNKNQDVVAELEGGIRKSGTSITPPPPTLPPTPRVLEADPLTSRRLADAEAEVERLRKVIAQSNTAPPTPPPDESRNESRIRDITRQRDLAQSQLKAAEQNVESLRTRLAGAPVASEMTALNARIANLDQEREAMAMALNQSRSSHTNALARIATLQADLTVMQQRHADLDRDIKIERKVANDVVVGQRTQLQDLEKQLNQKNTELTQANERISGLITELQESRDAFSELRNERDSLLLEREQMSALLKLNEQGRIQDLIEQNMGLAKNLREANEKVERLNIDNNASKDDVTDALRDLAIAKSQINKLHQEKRDQDKRLEELTKRLKDEELALSQGKTSADPAEVEVLRDIIRRQLSVQERRRQASALLIAAAKEMGANDEKLSAAVKLFDNQEIQLTPDEQRIIADKNVDGEFISPFAQDRTTVGNNTNELNRDIAVFERTAEKAFVSGRFAPARELLEMVVEENPGHISALCKLGIIHLKLNDTPSAVDTFRRAGELDADNPFARRMLGFSLMKLGDLKSAEQSIKEAIELAPDDFKSYMLLGTITFNQGLHSEAESHFKAAIAVDPLPSEPYFNLALICTRTERLDAAKTYYNQALERGAIPDPSLEQRFTSP